MSQKPQTSQLQILSKTQSISSYFSKLKFEFIIFTHFPERQPVQTLNLQISTLFFTQESMFPEANTLKNCRFYELILLDTKSARVQHIKGDKGKNFKYHKVHHDDPYVSIVREFKFKFWEKFNFDQRCNLDQVQRYLKHQTKQVMDNPSTLVKKDDKGPSSSSSKDSKKKATFKKFMK
ncbi:hypothetical protein Cgig2_029927 [Carnegiea gigantea]|uniref:Uncharacterized protein n=1 Tax=Carnegiea gigantea TaxID=171969 RepID=A0A9Q1GXE0_9CARY|nr:hypothetical protein Cgig2_029927 [Carnegiea gigantea]